MSTQAVIAIVIVAVVVVLLLAVVAAAARKRRSNRLRGEFGPEYDRTVQDTGKRRQAEKDLSARRAEHDQLQLRALTPAARERYTASWTQLQAKFIDAPVLAVNEADTLVTQLMAERGYPTEDFDAQARVLSVEHAHVLEGYRSAHDVELKSRAQQASTEDIRNAMLDFRRVFEDLMTTEGSSDDGPYPSERSDQPQAATDVGSRQRP
jgi:hypothetical protein